jgi:hypothetical protein
MEYLAYASDTTDGSETTIFDDASDELIIGGSINLKNAWMHVLVSSYIMYRNVTKNTGVFKSI